MAKTSSAVKNRYNAKTYDQLRVVVPKGRKADIEAHAAAKGQPVNRLVNELLRGELGMTTDAWGYKRGGESDQVLDD